eukprot:Sdes_comp15110_c0_seq1m3913
MFAMEAWVFWLLAAVVVSLLLVLNLRRSLSVSSNQKEKADLAATSGSAETRVAGGVRNARSRMKRVEGGWRKEKEAGEGSTMRTLQEDVHEVRGVGDEDVEDEELEEGEFQKKMGTKKLAKLEAKEEKKRMREYEEACRNEMKKREELLMKEKEKEALLEKKAEELEQELERKRLEEIARREEEEYLEWKNTFSVDMHGESVCEEADAEALLQKFVAFIQQKKVVSIEDVGREFHLKPQDVIDRIKSLQEMQQLSGLMDERGKFICISESELKQVAKFIRQRGRVTLQDLSENSNRLIDLNSELSDLEKERKPIHDDAFLAQQTVPAS